MNRGILFFATEQAKTNFKKKEKIKNNSCPSCEIKSLKIISDSNFIEDEIDENILKNTNSIGDI